MELSCSWYHHYMETPIIIPYNSMMSSNSMVLPDDTSAIQSRRCGQNEMRILMILAHLAWSWKKPLERWCWTTHTHTHTQVVLFMILYKGSCSGFCWSALEKRLVRNLKSCVRLQQYQQWNLWPWLAGSTFVMDIFGQHPDNDNVSNQVYNIAYIRLKLVETTK